MMLSLIFGGTLALFSNSSMSVIEQYCDERYLNNEAVSGTREVVSTIDDVIGTLITTKMCSDVCPCPDEAYKNYWLSMDEQTLNTFGRTKNAFSQDLVPLDFSGKGQKLYTDFKECLLDITKGETSEAQSEV